MPIQNFIGWSATGALFMGLSAVVWRTHPEDSRIGTRIASAVYFVNVAFAVVLSLSVGLWVPVVLAVACGVVPAVAACIGDTPAQASQTSDPLWSTSRL
jgi:putative membrane protein